MNPKLVIYGTTVGFALLTLGATNLFPFALIVLGMAVVGFIGCYVSTLPLFEYMGAVMASVAMAMVIPLEPWIIVIPGLVNGYVWGNVAKDRLEGGAIKGSRDHLKKSKKPKKRTSF